MENTVKTLIPQVQWYPGHMKKAKDIIVNNLKLVDVVIELLDARIPYSSANPMLQEIIAGKPRLVALNKSDLADMKVTKEWVAYFRQQGIPAVAVDAPQGRGIKQLVSMTEALAKPMTDKLVSKGAKPRAARVMILGIPNVGKSSFINRIAKKNVAQTGNKPGVTRQKQWIKVSSRIELLDTPGVLWPKLDQREVATNLAYTGTIKDDVLQTVEIGFELLRTLITNYTPNLMERYKLTEEQVNEIMQNQELEPNEKVLEVMNLIGRKRGAIISGGEIDIEKVANIIIDDFRSGRLGRITLETVKGE